MYKSIKPRAICKKSIIVTREGVSDPHKIETKNLATCAAFDVSTIILYYIKAIERRGCGERSPY